MFARAMLALTTMLTVSVATPALAGPPVPRAFRDLKPYQIVEQIMAQRQVLSLTEEQFARLDDLALKIRNERHRFIHRGGKPHETLHVRMITRQQAYDRALAILTLEQQTRFDALYPAPAPAKRPPRRLTVPHGKP